MSKRRMIACWVVGLVLACLMQWAQASAEDLTVKLGPELSTRAGVGQVTAKLGAGATVVKTPEGPGAEPGPSGPAVRVSVPAKAWPAKEGTIMMRVRVSRRVGYVKRDTKPRKTNIIASPVAGLELSEAFDGPRLRVWSPATVRSRGPVIRLAYLDPGKWYHVAVAWRAATGDVNVYVNGWAQQRAHLKSWQPPTKPAGELELGGVLGEGAEAARIAVGSVELHAWYMTEAQMRRALKGRPMCDVGAGVRQGYEQALDLSAYKLEPVFEPDFTGPLPIIAEKTLFEGDKRVREPKPGQWVLEGPAKAFTKDGQLTIDNLSSGPDHVVLWLPRPFPKDFLLEFDITTERPDEGLAIVFFAARPVGDPKGSISKLGLAKRNGTFKNYIVGDVNSYHVSYLAASGASAMGGPRLSANVRKNSGFWLVACGDDQIYGKGLGRGPHRVRFLKVGGQIRVEANGKLSVAFDDDGQTWGPVWGDGYIGLRQMNHLLSAQYKNLKVYAVTPK